jgi:NADPH:quinone reductase-like Zn-dependent oxidoreductase
LIFHPDAAGEQENARIHASAAGGDAPGRYVPYVGVVFAVYAASQDRQDPLSGLVVGEQPEPQPREGWVRVRVRAASLNHHDLWSLRGVGLPADRLPMILGCDAAGELDDGSPVVVHSVISDADWRGDETNDPRRSLLSERHPGTFADEVLVPRRNVIPLPDGMTMTDAACMPTAWLTAYRMLFTQADLQPGSTVLVQGAGGGVATALVVLGSRAGLRMWVTSRDEAKRAAALSLGADAAFEAGQRLPERVDAVMETVGKATWTHSLRSVRPGGVVVISGATSGYVAETELSRVFFLQLRIVGSTMGSRDELERLLTFASVREVRPVIDRVLPMEQAHEAFAALAGGDVVGKVVLTR